MRNTPQTTVILEELHKLGHATNRQLWEKVAKKIHGITLPSIHRTTQRLRQEGVIGCAPNLQGEGILDSNPLPHSHFMCRQCNTLTDIKLNEPTVEQLQSQLDQAVIEKCLFIAGICRSCVSDANN